MGADSEMGDVLAFLRGEQGPLGFWGIGQWLSFCKRLGSLGLLVRNIPVLAKLAPRPVVQQLSAVRRARESRMTRRLEAFGRFSDAAVQEHLRFVLIKGMAASRELYGDAFARQSSDIDILVTADDIPKADYVARKTGWVQPSEAFRFRQMREYGPATIGGAEIAFAPYPLRSSPFLPHTTNYFFRHADGQVDCLEIHDRFHGLSSAQATALLADPRRIELGDRRHAVLARPAQALLSVLSLHEDAVGVRANTRGTGCLGLKTCVDVERWLEVMDDGELEELSELIRSLRCDRLASKALGACCGLFPGIAGRACMVSKPSGAAWSMPYEARLLDFPVAARTCARDALRAVVDVLSDDCPASAFSDGKRHYLPASGSSVRSGFSSGVHWGDGSVLLSWTAPAALASPQRDLAFQAVLIGEGAGGDPVALRIDAHCENDIWTAVSEDVGPGTFDAHAGRSQGRRPVKCMSMPDGSGGLKVEALLGSDRLPGGTLRVLPAAYTRICASLFAEVAGWSLVGVAEEALDV